jgi:epoxyqueuosine reductase QueG
MNIRCGNCKERHESVSAVRECYDEDARMAYEEQMFADVARAEAGYERWLEDRGADEAAAQDAYEAARGVIPFDVAYAAALA